MAIPFYFAFLLFFPIFSQSQTHDFFFNGFNGSESYLSLDNGASIIKPSGALRLTNTSNYVIGHAFYQQPVQMFNKTSSPSPNASSFSTYFVFAIVPPSSGQGGYGLAFTLSPSKELLGGGTDHYLGIFNSSNDGNSSNHIFAVEFDTVSGFQENADTEGNHVGININSMYSEASQTASYYINNTERSRDMFLESGDPIQAWIEYDGDAKVVNVTISPIDQNKPIKPLISRSIDLTDYLLDTMYVGFSASTGKFSSSHYILGWSFSLNGTAPPLDLSLLPPVPLKEKDPSSSSYKPPIIALIVGFCSVTVILLGLLLSFAWHKWKNQYENMEEWELDCPHRFRYDHLYAATKGFKESEIIGVGGFGAVYKGLLPTSANEVAVKKITRNSPQGMREFAAEIESLGRLRHKNLVNLQGWCKRKNDLLLVYDYIPNGSLDSLLYQNGPVLNWEQRYNIIKGIAAGLLYLHEEWEQVVIHRDIKSSNVLIDAEMNARLGDFGLARLYDHGTQSHTTNIVGTIGYIAPELARSGTASASSDVFAYGVLLLEVASGRRPVGSNLFLLVDWAIEAQQLGRFLDLVDPKLNSNYVVQEMELVLKLGLLCSHQKPEVRPTMRQVVRYLNGDDPLPVVDNWSSFDSSQSSEMRSRFLEVISSDMSFGCCNSLSSTVGFSSNSTRA
ncbi:Pkinase domain-containing protein/Lectin_legB domain-containing protein [Cephalotus follicularis]|uniref:non-specific serine/threonine protein kinase n=1 Tax=Cephalotus follicularis TaxID=3775 RepID=A0A1Q3C0N5_CEPFO|nr:Pkinase domain-containing protein/Lectin_legB domain-containing protein [Cephalotus follicularis]